MTAIKAIIGIGGFAATAGAIFTFADFRSSVEEKTYEHLVGTITNYNSQNLTSAGLKHGSNDKNYTCKIEEIFINDCQIYKLNSQTQNNKLLENNSDIADDKKIVFSYGKNEKEKIVNNKNISIYKKETNELIFNISILNADKQKEKGFLSKTIIAKVKHKNVNVKDIGQSTYKCNLSGKSTAIDCEIFKLLNPVNVKDTKLPFDSSLSIEKQVEFKDEFDFDSYLIIKTNAQDLYSSDWSKQDTTISINYEGENSNFITIEYIATLADNLPVVPDSEYEYLVVEASAITPAQNPINPTPETFNGTNYKCIIPIAADQNVTDDDCLVFKSADPEQANVKLVDLHKITYSPETQKQTTAPSTGKNYVLKTKKNKSSKLLASGKITLVNKTNSEQKYIDLNKKHKLDNVDGEFKTNLLLVKVKTKTGNEPTGTENNYKCKFASDQHEKTNCKVYNFSTNPTTISNNQDFTIANIQKLNESTKTKAAAESYLIIEIDGENNKFTEKELRSFIPEIYTVNLSNETSFLKTEYIHSYVGNFSVAATTTGNLFRIKKSSEDYLVVKHTSDANPKESTELNASNTKNYKCKFAFADISIVDDSCELKIVADASDGKAISYSSITSSTTPIQNSNFATGKFFKLIINNPKMLSQINADSPIIITSNKATGGQDYGTVKVVSKNFNDIRTAKTELYLVKAKNPINTNGTNLSSTKCKLNNEELFSSCSIFKFNPAASSASSYTDLKFTESSTSVSQVNEITENNHYVIKFTAGDHQLTNINSQNLTLTLNSNSETKITDFELVSPIYSENNTHSSGTVVLLK